jgi:hypothetical protein
MDAAQARKLEVAARRPVGEALHPDRCGKLTLCGAAFAIPPRTATIVPVFQAVVVSVCTRDAADAPEARRLVELAEIEPGPPCPRCGRPTTASVAALARGGQEFLTAAFELAGRLLSRQYDLTAEQKADLLAFPADRLPKWIAELLEWCLS